MARISDISPDPRRPGRLRIFVDEKIVATLGRSRVEQLSLSVDQEWTSVLRQHVEAEAAIDAVVRQAMRMLNRRAMTRAEMEGKLGERGHDQDVVAEGLDRLERLGALDDAQVGRLMVAQLTRDRPAGAALLVEKLCARGLSEDLAERIVGDHLSGDDAEASARALVEQRLPSLRHCDPPTRARRLAGLLARRGFDEQTIESVVGAVVEIDDFESA